MRNNKTIKAVNGLIKNLSTRNKDIISRRFGLRNGKRETLEAIGQSYKITRERVRQIEDFSLRQLAKLIPDNSEVGKHSLEAKQILSKSGGIMRESDLFTALTGNNKVNVANASLVFLLTLAGEPVRSGENDSFHTYWALDRQHSDSFKNSSLALIQALNKHKKLIVADQLLDFASRNSVRGANEYMGAFMVLCKRLGSNVFGEVGLIDWNDIKPKGVRDKAYLVMKRASGPKHFSEITKMINSTKFSKRKANTQTVHNELIKDSRFVLVGRGLYGLTEWGYKPGTVKEVLIDILQNSREPIAKAELVAKTRNVRMVKENTILLNLQDSKVFAKKDNGSYTLRKA
jgi:hypothetical protein